MYIGFPVIGLVFVLLYFVLKSRNTSRTRR